MKKHKSLIYNLLAVIITASMLVSCSGTKNNDKEVNSVDVVDNIQDTIENETELNDVVEDNKNNLSNLDKELFDGYEIIEVDGGDLSGHREPNVAVNIGFGDREYWAFTNEHGQLVKVIAKEIILQDEKTEPVKSNGRYYNDEAKVPGTERKDLDEGHVIADSLGGVSNAYNITPQNSTLNRYGNQAYMEKVIRDAGGCTDFVAIITYPNTTTQIPSHYSYTYAIRGSVINDEFDNVDPDEYNSNLDSSESQIDSDSSKEDSDTSKNEDDIDVSEIVYWTPNGKSYHTRKTCPTLSRSKTILEGTIKQSGKHDPCDRCH